ncbi:hypothetical protein [Thiohalorhabdus methylotrophus]|uniref:Acyl-CoA dehydrogenase n=1 Tax=Thiohalorhabdus methylotrophus TaxID=3242694 RepID=A0ABV4TUG3_9GAMM
MDITEYPDEDRQAVAEFLRAEAIRLNRASLEEGSEAFGNRAEMLRHLADEVEPE